MDISYEKILYRIIKGRLRIKLGDLILYVYEPTSDILEESYEIYDEAYQKAYYNNVFIEEELRQLLYEFHLWNPADDKKIKELDKKIEELKLEAYKSFFDPQKLSLIKMRLKLAERQRMDIVSRNKSLDHVSCRGAAEFTRSAWIVENCTYRRDGSKYDWRNCSVYEVMGILNSKSITSEEFRMIARNEPWRSQWAIAKTTGDIFGKSSIDFTPNQISLCSYSMMYDNVYESPERPNEKIVDDDICLDGWFIEQKRKIEKQKKQQEVDALTKNSKIANSQEVFVMASNQEAANQIYDLNDPIARSTIRSRNAQIDQADGNLDFRQLQDIKQDMAIQGRQEGLQKMRGR